MKPEDIEQMKRDREAGTDGPWHLEGTKIYGHDPEQPDCPWIVARLEKHCGYPNGQETWPNGRRLVRVPALEAEVLRLREALAAIEGLGGNLPDFHWTTKTGPNDAELRGGLFVSAKEIARAALNGDAP